MGNKNKTVMITGSAGFIGMHTAELFLKKGYTVIGLDTINDYYSPVLKRKRNAILKTYDSYHFHKTDISDFAALNRVTKKYSIGCIIHLAAQAGVRYSLKNPWSYIQNNVLGTTNIFELAHQHNISKVVYASSSSVYGKSAADKFKETDRTDYPVSLYAATKKSCEAIAHAYHDLYGINAVGLRFFTVYGPYDRPDMAPFIFSKKMLNNEPIDVFAGGVLERDFTYIDDITSGIWGAFKLTKTGFHLYNLGGNKTHSVNQFISYLERSLGVEAIKNITPFQAGDVPKTSAHINKSKRDLQYNPQTPFKKGIEKRSQWFRDNWSWLQNV